MSVFIMTTFLLLGGALGASEVLLDQGPLRGTTMTTFDGRTVHAFMGVPYAKPAAGKYRFAESVPAGPWQGVYDATSYPSPCMQYSHGTYTGEFAVFGVEDCLYINVYTPKLPTPGQNDTLMDVVVYLHGGCFMFHYGARHGPRYLLDKDIVLVDFSYRVGALGFLSMEDSVLPGNNGLKDQVLALKWIQANIAKFGGDPNSVVLYGTSAGGASVHYHYLSPMSQGLFKAGHSMSGSAFISWTQTENARDKALRVATELGCPTNDTRLMVKCLRTRPASRIVGSAKLFMPWKFSPYTPFGPVVELNSTNPFLPESPVDIVAGGKAQDLPWLTTFTSHEGLYPGAEFAGDLAALKELDKRWNEIAPFMLDFNATAPKEQHNQISEAIRNHYLKGKKVQDAVPELIQMLGDRLFVADIVKAAKLQASVSTSPVYSYMFTYRGKNSASEALSRSKENFGTSHADDTCYVFQRGDMDPTETASDIAMMRAMVQMTADFVATGVPKFAGEQGWPTVKESLPEFAYREILSPTSAPVRRGVNVGQETFWDSLGLMENVPTTAGQGKDEL